MSVYRFKVISLAAVATLVLSGSALAYRVVRVGELANGKTIMVHPSDRLLITLPGNATTGYTWRVLHSDSSVLKFVSRKYVTRSMPPKVGMSGNYVLRFRAVGIGTTKLRLGYVQSGSSTSAKSFSLHVIVKSPAPHV
jgi:predicted secreted protein